MLLRIIALLHVFFFSFQCLGNDFKIINEIEKELKVKIVLNSNFKGSWETVTYEKIEDVTAIKDYLKILLFEYKKYPLGYLNKSKVNKIIICKNLQIKGQNRAAIPDPYKNALYLEVDTNCTENYLINVMHHELHHCAEYVLYGDMYYVMGKWNKKNIKDFVYGQGGNIAYENENIDYYTVTDAIKGFLNLYSTTGAEEDRCEIAAYIFNDNGRKKLLDRLKKDKILKKKVKLIIKEINSVAGVKFLFWNKIKKQSNV